MVRMPFRASGGKRLSGILCPRALITREAIFKNDRELAFHGMPFSD